MFWCCKEPGATGEAREDVLKQAKVLEDTPKATTDEEKKREQEEELELQPPDERAKMILLSGSLRLLSATWLLAQGDAFVIRRMQDLPQEAFLSPERAAEMFNVKWAIIVISYGWLSRKHPDPSGFHMRSVQKYLRKHKAHATWMKEFGVFWDFASLPQDGPDGQKKTEEEKKMFKTGLGAINLLYGAAYTIVIQLTSMPPAMQLTDSDSNPIPYYQRGWCFFEATVSALLKDNFYLLDLGLASGHLNNESSNWHVLMKTAICDRPPPLIPSEMEGELRKRKFTNGADVELVTRKYQEFFEECALHTTDLGFNNNSKGKGWNDDKVRKLSRALPLFKGLKVLLLGHHHAMGEAGLAAVCEAIKGLNLRKLIVPTHLEKTTQGQKLKQEWLGAGKKMAKDQKSEEGLLFG